MSNFYYCFRNVFKNINGLYLVPELYALVSIVWEGLARNKSTGTLLCLQLSFLIYHPTLTQHQRRSPTALQALKDVVF